MTAQVTTLRHPGIALVGYRGSGKSTIGPQLGEKLGLRFVDADARFEAVFRQSISTFFRSFGEAHFRELEAYLLKKTIEEGPCVLSTGGGVIIRESNRNELKRFGF